MALSTLSSATQGLCGWRQRRQNLPQVLETALAHLHRADEFHKQVILQKRGSPPLLEPLVDAMNRFSEVLEKVKQLSEGDYEEATFMDRINTFLATQNAEILSLQETLVREIGVLNGILPAAVPVASEVVQIIVEESHDKELCDAIQNGKLALLTAVDVIKAAMNVEIISQELEEELLKEGADPSNIVETAEKEAFRTVRQDVRSITDVFRLKVWPLSNDLVEGVKGFLDEFYAEETDFDMWLSQLDDCIECAQEQAAKSYVVGAMYTLLGTDFEKLDNPIDNLLKTFGKKDRDLEELLARLRAQGALLDEFMRLKQEKFGTFCGAIITFLTGDTVKFVVNKGRMRNAMNEKEELLLVCHALKGSLKPATQQFGDAMLALAGFFEVMTRKLRTLSTKPKDVKERHFFKYRKTAREVGKQCDDFNAIEATVRVKLACLPVARSHTDEEYLICTFYKRLLEAEPDEDRRAVLLSLKDEFTSGKASGGFFEKLQETIFGSVWVGEGD